MDIQMTAEFNDIQADGTSTRYREGILYRGVDDDTAHRAIDAGRATEVGPSRVGAVTLEAQNGDDDRPWVDTP